MDKPLTVARQEFIDQIVKVVNESPLPAFVLAEVIEKILNAVRSLEDSQYQQDLKAYQSAEDEEKEDGNL